MLLEFHGKSCLGINIEGMKIPIAVRIKLLGVEIDCKLKFGNQVNAGRSKLVYL